MAEPKSARAERRKLAAQNRANGQPEITRQGDCHIKRTCAGCVFWNTTDPELSPGSGVCIERSPQLVSVASINGNILSTRWPVTAATKTCGRNMTPEEYEAKKAYEMSIWRRN